MCFFLFFYKINIKKIEYNIIIYIPIEVYHNIIITQKNAYKVEMILSRNSTIYLRWVIPIYRIPFFFGYRYNIPYTGGGQYTAVKLFDVLDPPHAIFLGILNLKDHQSFFFTIRRPPQPFF